MSDLEQRFRRLGKYELHQLLGEGAMGIVWKAYDTVLRRFVALKLLSASFRKTKEMQERFLREARAAGAIQHANIVTVYDLGEAEGQLFIAMELVEGRDLSDMIALRDPLALERKLDITMEVLAGLQFAHQRGVIHRDVKPSNVRVMPDGRIKIMDFGIARLQKADATGGSGAIVGTPTYMAPEQITNGAITPATDVFSVGCMLYELLCYQRPFQAESVHGVLYQVLTTEPRPLRTVAPSIPAALERVVAKAMNKVPHERYESAGQMMSTLQQIRAALSGADEEATQPLGRWTPLPQPMLKLITHASMRARLAVLAALAAVVALLVYAPAQPADEPTPAASGPVIPPSAAQPGGLVAPAPAPGSPPVSLAVSQRRDSALSARDRAIAAGAQKNSVPSLLLAQSILETSDRALQRGDQSLALRGYVESAQRYGQAREEARAMDLEAQRMIERVTPVVQALPTGRAASNAGVFLARAESLLRVQDFTLAKVAAQSAEQIGIEAGIAPPSAQPRDARGAIDVLLSDLARALSSQRISNIRVLYPGLTDEERRGWEAFFREWSQITTKFAMEDFKVHGATATANVRAMFQYVPQRGGAPRVDRRRFAMRFERKDMGWRLTAVTELK